MVLCNGTSQAGENMTTLKHPEHYAGRWVALGENQQVAGFGETLEIARRLAHTRWPKEHLNLVYIAKQPPYLALPEWPLDAVRQLLPDAMADKVWLVGGPVRDLLQHKPIHDWDFAVDGDALRLARNIANAMDGAYYPLDVERGTARVIVPASNSQPACILDFAIIRGDTLEDDLRVRDFTLNAIAATLDGKVIDVTGGTSDLKQKCLRQVSEHSFRDDPARLLRALRLSSQHGYVIEEVTLSQIQMDAHLLSNIASERVFSELNRLLESQGSILGWYDLHNLGLLDKVIPELSCLGRIEQGFPHVFQSAWNHTLSVLVGLDYLLAGINGESLPKAKSYPVVLRMHLPNEARIHEAMGTFQVYVPQLRQYLTRNLNAEITVTHALKWAALFHDLGKASTRSLGDDGRVHFYQHAKRSTGLSQKRLAALKVPNASIRFITTLVQEHMRFLNFDHIPKMTRRTLHRYFRATGDAGVALALLTLGDTLGVRGNELSQSQWQRRLTQCEAVLRAWFDHQDDVVAPEPLLNGRDLMAMGIPQGPAIGKLLTALIEAQAAKNITDPAQAKAWIEQHRSDN